MAKSRTRQILDAGLQWSDTSAQRYTVARGYPDEEIAALLIHFCDYGKSSLKGPTWLSGDIARVIVKERQTQPDVTISPAVVQQTQAAAPLPMVQRASRARHDRPQHFLGGVRTTSGLQRHDAGDY